MYCVMTDLDGRFVLTYSGQQGGYWTSEYRFATEAQAHNAPDRLSGPQGFRNSFRSLM
jgi:hypothetical protein